MTAPPPPPPPPPPASTPPPPPPPPPTPPPPRTGWAGLHSLRDQPSPYGVWLALIVVLIFSAPNLLFLALDSVIQPGEAVPRQASEPEIIFGLVFALVLQLIIFVVALVPLMITRRMDRRVFGPSQPTGSWLGLGFGLVSGVVALVGAYALNIILALLFRPEDPVEQQLIQDALSGGVTLVLAGFIAVIVAPIVEEVVFRGILFRAIADRIGLWVGAFVSAAIFALIHIEVVLSQPVALGGLFMVGFLLALAYHWTGNLLVPILGHAVFNAASLGLALALERLGLDDLAAMGAGVRSAAGALVG